MVLGGGGYTIRNVSRAWAYETSVLVGEEVSNNIPYNDYFEYYAPNFKLHLEPDPDLENSNSREYLEEYKYVHCVPGDWLVAGYSQLCILICRDFSGSRSLRISALSLARRACR